MSFMFSVFFFKGFVNVRIWFPQLPGIVMMSDQEVIIMCKPPQSTVVQNMAAGFAGSMSVARHIQTLHL